MKIKIKEHQSLSLGDMMHVQILTREYKLSRQINFQSLIWLLKRWTDPPMTEEQILSSTPEEIGVILPGLLDAISKADNPLSKIKPTGSVQ